MNLHEIMLAKQLAGENGGGDVDLSDYYTKSQTDQRITEKVAEIVSDAPEDFDTLKEISDWIAGHEDSAAAMNSAIADNVTAIAQKADKATTYTKTETDNLLNNKVGKESGKSLSTNDFTNEAKNKLDSLENYDDTGIKADIAEVSSRAALNQSTLGYQSKNLLKNTAVTQTKNGVTFTVNGDGSVVVNGTATANALFTLQNINLTVGRKYTLSGCPSGGSSTTFKLYGLDTESWAGEGTDYGSGNTFTNRRSAVQYRIAICEGYSANNLTFYPMLRYAEITDDTYEPYKPSVQEQINNITDQILGLGKLIPTNSNLNTYTKPGIYYSNIASTSATLENTPYKTGGFRLEVSRISTVNGFMQTLYPNSKTLGCFFIRVFADGALGSWFKFSGEVVTTT
ncbi:MAG: pyocin knob domain-containing protein [Ruminococcus sp.]|nr:pyocin knob domain-containing protein [Ruminococcus sp.]